jgi:hypothetical protein
VSTRYGTHLPAPQPTRVCVELTCDLCGRVAPNPDGHGLYEPGAWVDEPHHIDAVVVLREEGSCYPGDERTTETESFDVCPTCWKTKVVPWFKVQGATPTISDY